MVEPKIKSHRIPGGGNPGDEHPGMSTRTRG